MHFIHERGQGANRIPILLLHGWPDSFVRFLKLIPLLTATGPSGISFDVVVPSMPGFGFSDKPAKPGMNTAVIAELYGGLMRQLGYTSYMVHGSDWGASIAEQLAIAFPEAVLGLHLTEVPWRHLFSVKPAEMTAAEKEYWHTGQQWNLQEGAYGMIQATKPQTLAYALNDSPIGLAAWIIEKFHAWSGADADLEKIYTRDDLLINLTIYWATQSAGSAARIYYETIHHPPTEATSRIVTPTAVCIAPNDIVPAPRDFAARFFNLRQWTTLSSGGHFLAMEQPEPLAEDILAFALKLNEV